MSRAVPVGDDFAVRRFSVFSPKVVAGINQVPGVLRTRVFQIAMPKRKAGEEIKSLQPDQMENWSADKRDQLAIFALRNAPNIAAMYDGRDDLVPKVVPGGQDALDDRLRDIAAIAAWSPVFFQGLSIEVVFFRYPAG